MVFPKGGIAWNRGKHGVQEYTAERSAKLSKALKGRKLSPEHRAKNAERLKQYHFKKGHKINVGREFSQERRENISKGLRKSPIFQEKMKARKGQPNWSTRLKGNYPAEIRKNMSLAHIGKRKGSLNNMWKGGITPKNKAIRGSPEYKQWREEVFKRDDYICVHCGAKGVYLHADHIKPFAYFPELRFDIDNGRTLCVPCHKKTPTFSGKGRWAVEKPSNQQILENVH